MWIYFTILGYLAYPVYIEFRVGKVIRRNNQWQPKQLLNYLRQPFISTLFWQPSFIDLNWIVFVAGMSLLGFSIEKLFF